MDVNWECLKIYTRNHYNYYHLVPLTKRADYVTKSYMCELIYICYFMSSLVCFMLFLNIFNVYKTLSRHWYASYHFSISHDPDMQAFFPNNLNIFTSIANITLNLYFVVKLDGLANGVNSFSSAINSTPNPLTHTFKLIYQWPPTPLFLSSPIFDRTMKKPTEILTLIISTFTYVTLKMAQTRDLTK